MGTRAIGEKNCTDNTKGENLEILTIKNWDGENEKTAGASFEQKGMARVEFLSFLFFAELKPAETYLVAGPWGAVASCYLHE